MSEWSKERKKSNVKKCSEQICEDDEDSGKKDRNGGGKLMTKASDAGDIKAVISVEWSRFHFEPATYETGIGTRRCGCDRKNPFGLVEKRQIRGKEKEELLDRIKKLSMLKKRERERVGIKSV